MELELIKKIAIMMTSEDKDMQDLGNTIFYGNNPTDEDITNINKVFGIPKTVIFDYDITKDVTDVTLKLSKGQVDIFSIKEIKNE